MLNGHHGIAIHMEDLKRIFPWSEADFEALYRCGKKRRFTLKDGIAVISVNDIADMPVELEILGELGVKVPLTLLNAEIDIR
jgi:hypothetical protein